jgi:PhnB protein
MDLETNENLEIVPMGYTAVTPWIITKSTEKMIDFLAIVFDAEEVPNSRIINAQGVIIHIVVKIGGALVMLFDARQGWGPTPSFLNFYVADIDKLTVKP